MAWSIRCALPSVRRGPGALNCELSRQLPSSRDHRALSRCVSAQPSSATCAGGFILIHRPRQETTPPLTPRHSPRCTAPLPPHQSLFYSTHLSRCFQAPCLTTTHKNALQFHKSPGSFLCGGPYFLVMESDGTRQTDVAFADYEYISPIGKLAIPPTELDPWMAPPSPPLSPTLLITHVGTGPDVVGPPQLPMGHGAKSPPTACLTISPVLPGLEVPGSPAITDGIHHHPSLYANSFHSCCRVKPPNGPANCQVLHSRAPSWTPSGSMPLLAYRPAASLRTSQRLISDCHNYYTTNLTKPPRPSSREAAVSK